MNAFTCVLRTIVEPEKAETAEVVAVQDGDPRDKGDEVEGEGEGDAGDEEPGIKDEIVEEKKVKKPTKQQYHYLLFLPVLKI